MDPSTQIPLEPPDISDCQMEEDTNQKNSFVDVVKEKNLITTITYPLELENQSPISSELEEIILLTVEEKLRLYTTWKYCHHQIIWKETQSPLP